MREILPPVGIFPPVFRNQVNTADRDQELCIGLEQMKPDRILAIPLVFRQGTVRLNKQAPRWRRRFRIEHQLEVKDYVVNAERLPIRPVDSTPQVEGPVQAVG